MDKITQIDPTQNIKLDFSNYVSQRNSDIKKHLVGGVPDYAFSLDATLRSKLSSFSILHKIGQLLCATTVPYQRQIYLMGGVAVSPKQFPEIYELGESCAKTLGIGIPQIFIIMDPNPNAFTYATDDIDQIIVMTSGLVNACNLQELKFVIGHECGHIHNQHVIFNTIWQLTVNPLAIAILIAAGKLIPGVGLVIPQIAFVLEKSISYVFGKWHRCAEITCDRAGVICNGDTQASMTALGRLVTGGADLLKNFNPEEYAKQYQMTNQSLTRFNELSHSHPLGPKRVEALKLFSECETLFSWRSELQGERGKRSKGSVDAECESFMR